MRINILIITVIILLQTAIVHCQNQIPKFKVSKKTTHKISKDQDYTFGYLEVPENRNAPSSRSIRIPIYIFKSRSPHPKPDPIIYTVGGPGASTMPSAQYMNYYQYLDDRDFILIEQRGTAYAKPHLNCPEWSRAVHLSNLPNFDNSQSDSLFERAAAQCKERLEAQKVDLNGYNSNEIAADIIDLVEVLGIEEFNLLTISYSTKIAQIILRDYPQKVRSVVMDSPLPLEVNYDEESVQNLLATLDKLLSDCASDNDCNEAFPGLRARFKNFLIQSNEQPLEITVVNPTNQNPETFKLTGQDLISVFTMASTSEVPNIPLEIERMLKGDFSAIKSQLANVFQEPGDGSGMGMRLSVWCTEELPFADHAIIQKETFRYPMTPGLSPAVFSASVCKIWGVQSAAPMENQPIRSDRPVLLISGGYDHETPPKWAHQMQKNLPNSFHLILEGWQHTPTTNWGNSCAMKLANQFFNNPGKQPMADCFNEIKAVQFSTE